MEIPSPHVQLPLPPELQHELDALTQAGSKVMWLTWKLAAQLLSSWAVTVGAIVLLDIYTHAGKLSISASFLVGALTGVAICLLVLLLQTSQEAMASLKADSGVIKTMAIRSWE